MISNLHLDNTLENILQCYNKWLCMYLTQGTRVFILYWFYLDLQALWSTLNVGECSWRQIWRTSCGSLCMSDTKWSFKRWGVLFRSEMLLMQEMGICFMLFFVLKDLSRFTWLPTVGLRRINYIVDVWLLWVLFSGWNGLMCIKDL